MPLKWTSLFFQFYSIDSSIKTNKVNSDQRFLLGVFLLLFAPFLIFFLLNLFLCILFYRFYLRIELNFDSFNKFFLYIGVKFDFFFFFSFQRTWYIKERLSPSKLLQNSLISDLYQRVSRIVCFLASFAHPNSFGRVHIKWNFQGIGANGTGWNIRIVVSVLLAFESFCKFRPTTLIDFVCRLEFLCKLRQKLKNFLFDKFFYVLLC
jgi:hypothetical protein